MPTSNITVSTTTPKEQVVPKASVEGLVISSAAKSSSPITTPATTATAVAATTIATPTAVIAKSATIPKANPAKDESFPHSSPAPNSPKKKHNQKIADEAFIKKDYDKALQYYDLALIDDPNNAILLNDKGLTLKWLNRLNEALACFDAILATFDDQTYSEIGIIPVLYNKAVVYAMLDRNEDTILCCQRILACTELPSSHRSHISAYHLIADAYFNKTEYKKAIENYEHAIKLRNWADKKKNIRLEPGKYEANAIGEELMKKANEEDSKAQKEINDYNLFAMFYRNGCAHYRIKEFEVALINLGDALMKKPKDIATHYLMGLSHYRLHNFNMASKCFSSVLNINKQSVNAWYNKGLADYEYAKSAKVIPSLNNFKIALSAFKIAKDLAPNDMDIVRAEGILLSNLLYLELLRKEQAKDTKDKKVDPENNKAKEGMVAIASSEPKPSAAATATPIMYAAANGLAAPTIQASTLDPATVSKNPLPDNHSSGALEPKTPKEPTEAASFVTGNTSFK